MNMEHMCSDLIGEVVTVSLSSRGFERNGFHNQISIVGTLQAHPDDNTQLRVVVSDGTFVYFQAIDVDVVNRMTMCPTVITLREDSFHEQNENGSKR